jgi:hypothetical protein
MRAWDLDGAIACWHFDAVFGAGESGVVVVLWIKAEGNEHPRAAVAEAAFVR